MKRTQLTLLLGAFTTMFFVGCQLTEDSCDPDQYPEYGICAPLPPEGDGDGDGDMGDGDGDAEGGAGGGGGAAPVEPEPPIEEDPNFGDACSEGGEECKGGTICAAPQLPICTQVNCMDGEANEGACPDGMTCTPTGQDPPSICL